MKNILRFIMENTMAGKIEKQTAIDLTRFLKEEERRTDDEPVAIIGISLHFPYANGLQQYWEKIVAQCDCIREAPEGRSKDIYDFLHFAGMKPSGLKLRYAGFLEEIDKFDPDFFQISPKEASLMDPNQRLFLQTVWEAIEDAGLSVEKLEGTNTGVYVGFTGGSEYRDFIMRVEPEAFATSLAGNLTSVIASRVSYHLNLRGPSLVLDTACSSSLVAVHYACQGLRKGECTLAIAGSVKITFLPLETGQRVGIESQDGKARAFSDDSDGTGMGEGVAALVLKPLSKALVDRDHVYAVIKGSAVNQDGRSNGITAPNPEAQEQVIVRAWRDSGIDPTTITYIEAHGTGTKLGDPIEIDGIRRAFSRYTERKQFCAISSVKSNIGHLDHAAGIAGLTKAVLALQYKLLPPTLHFQKPNAKIPFTDSPVFIVNSPQPWESEGIRRCGVSSFGLGGTNCHLVLEEAPLAEPYVETNGPHIFTLSAKYIEALRSLVEAYLRLEMDTFGLGDLCYTANTGRGHYHHRLAVVCGSKGDLLQKLRQFLSGSIQPDRDYIFLGEHKIVHHQKQSREPGEITRTEAEEITSRGIKYLEAFLATGKMELGLLIDLSKQYVQGAQIPWEKLYRDSRFRRVSLPVYPFAAKRCWLDLPEAVIQSRPLESLDINEIFYGVNWKLEKRPKAKPGYGDNGTIILYDAVSGEKGAALAKELRRSGKLVTEALLNGSDSRLHPEGFVLKDTVEAYACFFQEHADKQSGVTRIVLMVNLIPEPVTADIYPTRSTFQLYRIYRAMVNTGMKHIKHLIVIAGNTHRVNGEEEGIDPGNAALFGLVKSIGMESMGLKCRCLDPDPMTEMADLVREIDCGATDFIVAYRNGKRYVEEITRVPVPSGGGHTFLETGVYLITGGLGRIGLEFAKCLAAKGRPHLALLGRTPFPPRSGWEEIISRKTDKGLITKILALKEIEQRGGTVEYFSVDITVKKELEELLGGLRRQYGRINGVIHCAGVGVGQEWGLLHQQTEAGLEEILRPKIQGTWLLDQLTRVDEPDFFLMCSSIITTTGGIGVGGYLTANAFLDAYTAFMGRGGRAMTVNWPTWENSLELLGSGFDEKKQLFKTISVSTAIQAWERTAACPRHRLIIGALNTGSELLQLEGLLPFRFSEELQSRLSPKETGLSTQQTTNTVCVSLKGRDESAYTKTEKEVASIWGEVLGFTDLLIDASFYELGGDSIFAMKIANLVNKRLEAQVEVSDLLRYSTVADFAAFIDQSSRGEVGTNQLFAAIQPAREWKTKTPKCYPTSSAQRRMYILNQFSGRTTAYNMPFAMALEEETDHERVLDVIRVLVKRHEALRTSFKNIDGELVQEVHAEISVPLDRLTCETGREDEAMKTFIKPFDLGKPPLFRVCLLKTSAGKQLLLFDIHHIVSDGASMNILPRDFLEIYQGYELPPLTVQYKDYAAWQKDLMSSDWMKKQELFWLQTMEGELPTLEMPYDFERPPELTFNGNAISGAISPAVTQKLHSLARKSNTTLNILMHTVYTVLLQKYTDQCDIIVGNIVAGRRHADLENIVGMFANFLPVRLSVNPEWTFTRMLEEATHHILKAYDNQEYPFEKMVELCSQKISRSRNPFFDTMLSFHNESNLRPKEQSVTVNQDPGSSQGGGYELNKGTAALDFKVDVYFHSDGGLLLILEYNTDLFQEETMHSLLQHFGLLLEQIVLNPEKKVADIGVFPEPRKQISGQRKTASLAFRPLEVVVSASFTAEPLADHLRWWCRQFHIEPQIRFAPYNQVFQELLDEESMVSACRGMNIICLRFEDWFRDDPGADRDISLRLEEQFKTLTGIMQKKSKKVPYLVTLFPVASMGLSDGLRKTLEDLTGKWQDVLEGIPDVYTVDLREIDNLYQIQTVFDPLLDQKGHIPFTEGFYAAMGTILARKISSWLREPFKVIALDCDQTLWRGICGEDGPLGVHLEESFLALQRFVIDKWRQGMLVVLCSKNNEQDVWDVFDRNPEMLLRREHLAGWRINWQAKSENLLSLARELNVGIDSFIFIDDSPVECTEVMTNRPEVLTLQLPKDPEVYPVFLYHIWAFDRFKLTTEDLNRTRMYQAEKERQEIQAGSASLDDFLMGLNLKVSMCPVEDDQIPRVAQLTQRTNQFNMSTIRRTEEEMRDLIRQPGFLCYVIEVTDRFGDYGLVGVVIVKREERRFVVDTFLLSCRVLGRRVEDTILTELKKLGKSQQLEMLEAIYVPTAKNKPFLDFLEKTGWEKKQESAESILYYLPFKKIPDRVEVVTMLNHRMEGPKVAKPTLQPSSTLLSRERSLRMTKNGYHWELSAVNENMLYHRQYLLPLRHHTAQELLNLPVAVEKKDTKKHEYMPPRTEIERKLAGIWQKVLGVSPVGIDDNFFALGGNSLLIIKMEVELERENLKSDDLNLNKYQTIRRMATLYQGGLIEAETSPAPEDEPGTSGEGNHGGYRKVITGIEPFNDIFYKNCFYNSAFPVVRAFGKRILPFLINDVVVYTTDSVSTPSLIKADYLSCRPVGELLQEEGIVVSVKTHSPDVLKDIRNAIDQNRPVVIWIDCFYESIRSDMYQKNHWPHTWLIFGYDEHERVCHIMEHQHRDNLTYEKRTLRYEEVEECYAGYIRNFAPVPDFATYYELSPGGEELPGVPERYTKAFYTNLRSFTTEISKGLALVEQFSAEFGRMVTDQSIPEKYADDVITGLNDIINCKQVERYKWDLLFGPKREEAQFLEGVLNGWTLVRTAFVRYVYTSIYKQADFEQARQGLEHIGELEKIHYEKIFRMNEINTRKSIV